MRSLKLIEFVLVSANIQQSESAIYGSVIGVCCGDVRRACASDILRNKIVIVDDLFSVFIQRQ